MLNKIQKNVNRNTDNDTIRDLINLSILRIFTVSLAGAERVDASEPVELDRESPSFTGSRNVSLIHLR